MAPESVDIAIIGAGIHGAGVAQAAAARGYSTLVLEQYEKPACGTSSRSSKLIHGGLRYLENGRLSLVKECLRERSLLLRNAPGLVKLVPFHIPIYEETTRRPTTIRAGLSIYALLTGLKKEAFFKKLPKSQWRELDGLKTKKLKAVYRYWDAQTDDAALTAAALRSAMDLGCCQVQYDARVDCIELLPNGAHVDFALNPAQKGQETKHFSCLARSVVNAAGPWADSVLKKVRPALPAHPVDLVQGAHIIAPGKLEKGIYYMESPRDQRAVFAMPWRNETLIGTTETNYCGDPGDAKPLATEIDYLLETFNHYFPGDQRIERSQILSSFAGLRVLPRSNGAPFSRSRETDLVADREEMPRLLSIYGGKLTTFRATGEKALNKLAPNLPKPKKSINTKRLTFGPQQGSD